MPKLHQILAIESGEKKKAHKQVSELHKAVQKSQLFEGHVKTYHPKDEEGERLPKDTRKVQIRSKEVLQTYEELLSESWNVTATKEWGNYNAPGVSLEVDGTVLAEDVPIPFLLYLSKQLDDVETALRALPTLDPSIEWELNSQQGFYQSPSEKTSRSQKIRKNHVLSEATDKHPAQVQIFTEDVNVGSWETIRHSGAISVTEKDALLGNVAKVKQAVIFAREQANEFDVEKKKVAKPLFDFIFSV